MTASAGASLRVTAAICRANGEEGEASAQSHAVHPRAPPRRWTSPAAFGSSKHGTPSHVQGRRAAWGGGGGQETRTQAAEQRQPSRVRAVARSSRRPTPFGAPPWHSARRHPTFACRRGRRPADTPWLGGGEAEEGGKARRGEGTRER